MITHAITSLFLLTLSIITNLILPGLAIYFLWRKLTGKPHRASSAPRPTIFPRTVPFTLHRVVDGDSIEIAHPNGEIERVRLLNIDAPEYHTQPHGKAARTALETILCPARTKQAAPQLTIKRLGYDLYGRTLAHVWANNIHTNEQMVREGHAWADASILMSLAMRKARFERRGLWADTAPIRPHIWRRLMISRQASSRRNPRYS